MNPKYIYKRNSLLSVERLKSRKQIEMLFQNGEAFSFFPLRVIYRLAEEKGLATFPSPVQIGFSIPKKKFHKAHDRNLVRRLLKEAWRTQKHSLYKTIPAGKQLHCFVVFTGKEIISFKQSEVIISGVIRTLIQKVKATNEQQL